jgi:hypothetical protein
VASFFRSLTVAALAAIILFAQPTEAKKPGLKVEPRKETPSPKPPDKPVDLRSEIGKSDQTQAYLHAFSRWKIGTSLEESQAAAKAHAQPRRNAIPLPGREWLMIRITEIQEYDQYIVDYAQRAASRYFDLAWSLEKTEIIPVGLGVDATKQINDAATRTAKQEEVVSQISAAISKTRNLRDATQRQALIEALIPVKEKLLILVSHHEDGSGPADSVIPLGGGSARSHLVVEELMNIGAEAGVRIFVLGCNTSASQTVGTQRHFFGTSRQCHQ